MLKNKYRVHELKKEHLLKNKDHEECYIIKEGSVLARDEKGKTILFHSTGHVAAGWIADYLKDDLDIWGIDIGRSFDWDIKNKVRKYPELVFPTKWTEVDKHQMVEHIKRLRNG